RDGPTGGNESERSGDHLITGTDVEQQHGHVQRRGAAVEAHAMFGPTKAGEVLFKLRDLRPETKRALVERARNRRVNVLADGPHLRRQIEVGDGGGVDG